MKRLLLTGIAALFLATGAAHAQTWACSDAKIKLRKHAVHLYEFTIEGRFHAAPLPCECEGTSVQWKAHI